MGGAHAPRGARRACRDRRRRVPPDAAEREDDGTHARRDDLAAIRRRDPREVVVTDDLQDPRFADLRRKCAERGITIMRRGACWLLEGPGVRLLVRDLRSVGDVDLQPAREYGRGSAPDLLPGVAALVAIEESRGQHPSQFTARTATPSSAAYVLRGRGVHLIVASLRSVLSGDLEPTRQRYPAGISCHQSVSRSVNVSYCGRSSCAIMRFNTSARRS